MSDSDTTKKFISAQQRTLGRFVSAVTVQDQSLAEPQPEIEAQTASYRLKLPQKSPIV